MLIAPNLRGITAQACCWTANERASSRWPARVAPDHVQGLHESMQLYLPEEWANNPERRQAADVPKEVQFQTKPQIALAQIRQAVENRVAPEVVAPGFSEPREHYTEVRER
jgi:hypothetical protein